MNLFLFFLAVFQLALAADVVLFGKSENLASLADVVIDRVPEFSRFKNIFQAPSTLTISGFLNGLAVRLSTQIIYLSHGSEPVSFRAPSLSSKRLVIFTDRNGFHHLACKDNPVTCLVEQNDLQMILNRLIIRPDTRAIVRVDGESRFVYNSPVTAAARAVGRGAASLGNVIASGPFGIGQGVRSAIEYTYKNPIPAISGIIGTGMVLSLSQLKWRKSP